jgi:hypothetical protein
MPGREPVGSVANAQLGKQHRPRVPAGRIANVRYRGFERLPKFTHLGPLNRGLSVDKFDLHSIDLSYGPWQKSRKGSDQPRAWREPCNCRERFFHFGAGERLT